MIWTKAIRCIHPLVKHCGSWQLQFFTTLTLNSNASWIGDDQIKSHKAHFYWLLADLSVVNLAIHMPHVSLICTRTIHLQQLKGWLILIQLAPSQQVSVWLVTTHHSATRNSSKKQIKSFKWSNSASLGHSPYRQRLLLNRCLAAWNWKIFIPSSGLQGGT